MGSSNVIMCSLRTAARAERSEAMVVDLPDPVAPQTKTNPSL